MQVQKRPVYFCTFNNLENNFWCSSSQVVYNPANFAFDGSIEADLEDIEDFSVRLTADSPYLKLNKWEVQANNKAGAKGAKRIQFSASSEGKNTLSGSTSYKVHKEGDKFIVEGSGDVKIKDKSKSANFKFIKQSLSLEKNGEKGVEFSFDAVLGEQAIDSELKITNKQFRLLDSYCEEKKKCAHIEIDSKTNANGILFHTILFVITIHSHVKFQTFLTTTTNWKSLSIYANQALHTNSDSKLLPPGSSSLSTTLSTFISKTTKRASTNTASTSIPRKQALP